MRGRGAFGPPSGGRDQPPGGIRDGDGDRPRPPPRRRAAGGVPAGGGRIRRRRRHGRRQGRQPHAKAAAASDRATAPTAERPGGGAAGPGQYRPGLHPTGRIPFCPSPPPLGAGWDNRHGGGPARRALCARDSGRAEGPRGGRIRTRSDGAGGCRFGTGWGGGTDRSRGHPSRSWGGVGGKKKWPGGLPPPAGHDWTKKKCGEDALSPPLAVTADTRYPPVRRSSPKRTRCRPVPCALAMRRLPRPPSCLP